MARPGPTAAGRAFSMLELMIETWTNPQSGTTYRWSAWRDGQRLGMGGPHKDVAESEAEGLEFCRQRQHSEPDRITRL